MAQIRVGPLGWSPTRAQPSKEPWITFNWSEVAWKMQEVDIYRTRVRTKPVTIDIRSDIKHDADCQVTFWPAHLLTRYPARELMCSRYVLKCEICIEKPKE